MIEKISMKLPSANQLLSWCIVLLAFSLPFERIPSALISGFSLKMSVILSVVVIALSLMVGRRQRVMASPLYVAISLFVIWLSARMVGVEYKKEALKIYIPLVLLASLSLAMSRAYEFINIKRILQAILLSAAIVAGFGIFQFIGDSLGLPSWLTGIRPEYASNRFGFPRLHSTLLEPLFYGNFMLLPLALLTHMLVDKKKAIASKRSLAALFVVIIFTILLTVSRGALAASFVLLAVSSASLIFTKVSIDIKRLLIRGLIAAVLMGVLLVAILSVLSTKGTDTDNTYNTKGALTWLRHIRDTRITPNNENIQKDDSIAQRATARNQAISLLNTNKSYWLIGVGPGQYLNKEMAAYGYSSGDANVMFLAIIMHAGLIGLVLVGAIFVTSLYYCWKFMKQKSSLHRLVGMSFIAYILAWNLQALSFGSLAITHLWFAIGLVGALSMQNQNESTK